MQRFDVTRLYFGSLEVLKQEPLGKTAMDATQSAPGVKNDPIWRSSAPHTAEILFTESAN